MAPKDTDQADQYDTHAHSPWIPGSDALEEGRKQFLLDYYPDLVLKLATSDGNAAVERVSKYLKGVTVENTPLFCKELSLAYFDACIDEMLSSQLSLPRTEELWDEKYEPQLFLALDVAAAMVDWSLQNTDLDSSESMGRLMDSISDTQKDAVRKYHQQVGQGVSQMIIDYKRIARRSFRTSLMETKREFSSPSNYVKHGVSYILRRIFSLLRLSRRSDRKPVGSYQESNQPGKTPLEAVTCVVCCRKRNVPKQTAIDQGRSYVCSRCTD